MHTHAHISAMTIHAGATHAIPHAIHTVHIEHTMCHARVFDAAQGGMIFRYGGCGEKFMNVGFCHAGRTY